MDLKKIARMIGQCTDKAELNAVRSIARKRLETIETREYQAQCDAAWERVVAMRLKPGDKIYDHGPRLRGMELTVTRVMPRRKLLFVAYQRNGCLLRPAL